MDFILNETNQSPKKEEQVFSFISKKENHQKKKEQLINNMFLNHITQERRRKQKNVEGNTNRKGLALQQSQNISHVQKSLKTSPSKIMYLNLPYFSRKRRAFSRKDGPPSISSSASNIGLPTTKDLTGRLSLPGRSTRILVIPKYM